jgi:hypothetical protein
LVIICSPPPALLRKFKMSRAEGKIASVSKAIQRG